MTTLFALLPLAGCTAMCVLCARRMSRGRCAAAATPDAAEVTQLRAEVAELRARLEPVAPDQLPSR